MSVKFGVYKTPKPTERKGENLSHARLLTCGTRKIGHICAVISECTSLTSSDIKGVLDALSTYMTRELADGYNVELEGVGHFSVALNSHQKLNGKGKPVVGVSIDGVNFRCSMRLKEGVKETTLTRKRIKQTMYPADARKTRMTEYIEKYGYINASLYAEINNCTRYLAGRELKQFVADAYIVRIGGGSHVVYQLINKGLSGGDVAEG